MKLSGLIAGRLRAVLNRRYRRKAGLTGRAVQELVRNLEDQKRTLETFTASMEEEFLQLGTLLGKITALVREVNAHARNIMNAAAGRTEDAAIQFAFQLLKKAEDLVNASREQYTSVFQVFEGLHADLARVAGERGALMRTLLPLGIITTQFRIEASALDEHTRGQFFTLAETIAGIVRDVQVAVGMRFEELDRTGRAAGETVSKLANLAEEQRRETERMLAETRAHLSALNEALLVSGRSAQSVSQAGSNIARGVGQAIVGLQCQDMARQKLQHIGAAIDEMIAHLASALSGGFRRAEETDCRHFLAEAGRVQLGQLRAVFAQLNGAAGEVSAGLEALSSDGKALAEHAVQCGGAALDGRIIQHAIESIHAVLGVIESAVTSLKSVVELILHLKSTFSDCTSQILGLALRLRNVALNAQIYAAYVEAGAALEVVAKNTRLIADESMQQLDGISSQVTQVVNSVTDLEQRLVDYSDLASMEQTLLAAEAAKAEQKLGELEQGLRAAVKSIAPLEQSLTAAIQDAVESIRFPALVATVGARSTSLFQGITEEYSQLDAPSHVKVMELKRNYTMAHERAVHELAVGAAQSPGVDSTEAALQRDGRGVDAEWDGPPEPSSAAGESEGMEEKIADNVELF